MFKKRTKMIRVSVGGDQEQSTPDLTTGNGIQGENICIEIPSLRESASKTTIKLQESPTKTTPTEVGVADQDLQTQRRTSHRLLTANRNETAITTSTLLAPRSIDGGMDNVRNSEQRMSSTSDPPVTGIICSLPLNRLESVLGMLNVIKQSPLHSDDLTPTEVRSCGPDRHNGSPAGSESTHDAPIDSTLAYKVLCLYCDRSFSSQKLMIKHSDRIHRIAKDRRSSARVLSTALNGSDVSSCCHFCHKSKPLNLVSENLPELFKHLSSVHSDRYYACVHCILRFPNDEAREAHMESLHPSTNSGRPKSKAALKAFSYGQNNCTLHHQQPVVSVVNCKTLKTAGNPPEATTPSSMPLELSSRPTDRHVLTNRVNSNSSSSATTKGELASVQNICLRSSLRNATAPTEKVTESSKSKTKAFKKSERLLRRNSEPMLLSRLGITQHRLPRQSRRLLAAASTNANATLLSSDTSSASSTSSTSSVMASCMGKFSAKKKLLLSNDEVQPVQNCYSKITKLKTIRSTLNTNSMPIADSGTVIETADSGKSLGKGSDGTANGSAAVSSNGSSNDTSGGLNNRGALHNSTLSCHSVWGNSTGSISSNASNGSAALLATSSGIFEEDFYETVTQNVKNNLSCHLDGKLEASTPYAPSPMSPVSVVPAVRSTVVKSPVSTDSKIHEATNLPAISVMFPTLLTVEQYGTDPKPTTSNTAVTAVSSGSSVRTKKPVTKNSWKWKWDFVKKYKYVNENGRIVKKIKQPTIGLRDLSKLDMWTQLTMRTKHELFQYQRLTDDQHQQHVSPATHCDPSAKANPTAISEVGATLRHAKRAMVEQLDNILDARLLPHIDLEQNDQRIIKLEPSDEHIMKEETEPVDDKEVMNVPPVQNSSLVPWSNHPNTHARSKNSDFLHNLQLIQLNKHHQNAPVVLSGEWARPRCYICYGCGAKFNSLKQVEEHRIFRHPHVQSTFYEIVGRELIEKRLYKHFFIPVIALMMHRMHCMRISNSERIMNSPFVHGMNPQHAVVCRINTVTEIKNEDTSSNEATSFSTSTSASSSSRNSMNTTTSSTLMDGTDAINVLAPCSALAAIDDEDEGNCARPVI
uniref:C2H2-type domain-containing protein n=1 Tax=Anopheles culicifacies TaxID=139723 RepID=A0A182ML40_9DIPT